MLNKFQTPLLKINNESAKFIFYKNLIATQQLSFWQQNPVLKKTLSSSWLTKPKTTSWLNTLQKITFVRRNLLKRKTVWKKKNFVFVQQLKTKFSTNKQKQILTALAKTKTKNHILYGKLIHIAPRSQSMLLKKLVWNLKNEILNNKKKIQKLKKFYTFLLLATPRSPVKKNSKKNLKTLTLARVNHQKFRFLWKILKKKINLFQRARFLKKELPFLLLNFDTKLSPLKEKYNWSFLKKASLLKKILYLNFLIALFLNKNFLAKNYFLDKQFQSKIQLKKNTNRKEITFPSTRSFQIQTFLKANFLNTKKNKTWKKSPYINVYYQNYIWLLLRKKKA